jgi:hypothetical protein
MRKSIVLALAGMALTGPVAAQSRVVMPAGTVILVRTMAPLNSSTMQVGQMFETSVDDNIEIDDFAVIPASSRIRGRVTMVRPATRQQSGVIDLVFDRVTLPDGSTIAITGKLTSTDSAERRQINADPNAHVVLVGARGGIGATIAGAAGASGSSSSILSVLGSMLSEGRDVNVPAGTPLAVEIERAVTLRTQSRMRAAAGTIYTAADRIRGAQEALRSRGYYRGALHGQLDDATRRALFEFQVDQRLSATGNLDGRTAQSLGLDLANTPLTGAILSAADASAVRRDAASLVMRMRTALSATGVGQLDATRLYSQPELELWFALSAFSDNASLYEAIVRGARNENGAILAGHALAAAARRVDTALQSARAPAGLDAVWAGIKRRIAPIN